MLDKSFYLYIILFLFPIDIPKIKSMVILRRLSFCQYNDVVWPNFIQNRADIFVYFLLTSCTDKRRQFNSNTYNTTLTCIYKFTQYK